jgi:transposase
VRAHWFERLLAELRVELWIGDATEIRTKRVRKQKTDRQDAQLILRLMIEVRFPRIWVPNWENRDVRQLLWHRHRMVQARSRIMNQLLDAIPCPSPTPIPAQSGEGADESCRILP